MKYFVIFLILIGFAGTAHAQYMGNLGYPINTPNECTAGPGMECPLEIIDKTKWKVGTIAWDKPLYHEKKLSEIQTKVIVNDFDMNTHPTIKDWVSIQLWSKSSPEKINLQLNESSENSGIFEGFIILLNESSNPFQNKLKVNKTDIVFASYYDWTLPENQNSTKIEIITESLVRLDSENADMEYYDYANIEEEFIELTDLDIGPAVPIDDNPCCDFTIPVISSLAVIPVIYIILRRK